MACGGCKTELDALRQEVVELRSVLAELRDEYLSLAKDFDRIVGVQDDEDEEPEEGEEERD